MVPKSDGPGAVADGYVPSWPQLAGLIGWRARLQRIPPGGLLVRARLRRVPAAQSSSGAKPWRSVFSATAWGRTKWRR